MSTADAESRVLCSRESWIDPLSIFSRIGHGQFIVNKEQCENLPVLRSHARATALSFRSTQNFESQTNKILAVSSGQGNSIENISLMLQMGERERCPHEVQSDIQLVSD
jgi:hypothetical protein